MDNFGVAELVSALEEEEEGRVGGLSHGYEEDDPTTTSTPHHPKTFPLKTSKQRSSNRKAKNAAAAAASTPGLQQKRSPRKEANSTDDDESGLQHKSPPLLQNNNNNNNNNVILGGPPQDSFYDKPFKTSPGGVNNGSGGGGGLGDSDDNITERLSSTLSLQGDLQASGPFESCPSSSTPTTASSTKAIAGSDSVAEVRLGIPLKQQQQPLPGPSSACHGRSFGGGSPPPLHNSVRDQQPPRSSHRRRRRRRGHANSTKRMAVDNNSSPPPHEVDMEAGDGRGRSKASPSYRKVVAVVAHEEKKKKGSLVEGALGVVDRFGMKRKRNLLSCFRGGLPSSGVLSSSCPESSGVGTIGSEDCCGGEDEEMKSDEEEDDSEYYSTSGDDDKDDDDRGREADDEQSDWVFDEWSNNASSASGGSGGDRSEGESAVCRRRRLMKMLRNYKSMISAGRDSTPGHQQLGEGRSASLGSREILAGKRRVLSQPTNFPASRSIWTSANEEVSKFLQDPLQSQIKLQPIPAEERVGLTHLASLYSLHMDYCSNDEASQDRELAARTFPPCVKTDEDPMMITEQQNKLYPILTKTPNTTQMDINGGIAVVGSNGGTGDIQGLVAPHEMTGDITSNGGGALASGETSNFHTSCSSSSFGALERSYCPTVSYSDVDSIASDSKRIKK